MVILGGSYLIFIFLSDILLVAGDCLKAKDAECVADNGQRLKPPCDGDIETTTNRKLPTKEALSPLPTPFITEHEYTPVSYTHLTLPTILLV